MSAPALYAISERFMAIPRCTAGQIDLFLQHGDRIHGYRMDFRQLAVFGTMERPHVELGWQLRPAPKNDNGPGSFSA
jgi:hypothetical protein